MFLSEFAKGRDNNLNLIRILAATAVLVSHSVALATGNPHLEPLDDIFGFSLGTIAVDIFFLISGFLITASLFQRKNLVDYVWARGLRIFPGLIVSTILTVFLLGPLVTELPLFQYLTNPLTYKYLFKNIAMFLGIEFELPGVFVQNIFPSGVNGSLWTLPQELLMYIVLAVFWILAKLSPLFRDKLFKWLVLTGTAVLGMAVVLEKLNLHSFNIQALHMYFMFFVGACFFLFKNKIPMHLGLFFGFLVLFVVGFLFRPALTFVYTLSLPYMILYLSFVPGGFLRRYNILGDYSYGLYIYAFPLQQLFCRLFPGIDAYHLTFLALPATLLLAVLSWHLVEKKALTFKEKALTLTNEYLGHLGKKT